MWIFCFWIVNQLTTWRQWWYSICCDFLLDICTLLEQCTYLGYLLLEAPREYVQHGPLVGINWLRLCPVLPDPGKPWQLLQAKLTATWGPITATKFSSRLHLQLHFLQHFLLSRKKIAVKSAFIIFIINKIMNLKGQCHEIFCLQFFLQRTSPGSNTHA
jgi:hypothetical protein